MTTDGVRRLLAAADRHRAAAAAARAADLSAAAAAVGLPEFSLDVSSCRGLDRRVRQAAAQGMQQLREALGMSPAPLPP